LQKFKAQGYDKVFGLNFNKRCVCRIFEICKWLPFTRYTASQAWTP